jgi:hypothetical protein
VIGTAIVGIIGVGVGAIVTGGIQFFTAWRARKLEAQVAARLLAGELTYIHAFGKEALKRVGWPTQSMDRHLRDWPEQRYRLAAALSAADWFTVAGAVSCVEQWIELRDAGVARRDAPLQFMVDDLNRIRNAIQVLVAASKLRTDQPVVDEIAGPATNTPHDEARDG